MRQSLLEKRERQHTPFQKQEAESKRVPIQEPGHREGRLCTGIALATKCETQSGRTCRPARARRRTLDRSGRAEERHRREELKTGQQPQVQRAPLPEWKREGPKNITREKTKKEATKLNRRSRLTRGPCPLETRRVKRTTSCVRVMDGPEKLGKKQGEATKAEQSCVLKELSTSLDFTVAPETPLSK